jgi:2-keto-4-pentenoate hydratase/2-oxohepta-3-ene-1,7-dioic acid hydratase in catechol pathway
MVLFGLSFLPHRLESNVRIATISHQGRTRVGIVSTDARRIALFDGEAPHGVLPWIEAQVAGAAWPPPCTEEVPLEPAALLAPLPRPRRNLWCVGRNYHAHAAELQASVFKDNAAKVDAWPIVFTKVPETVVGPHADVRLPGAAISSQIDYEAELTIVIGRGGRNIARADAMSHVFGYTIINDVTARDVQMRHAQWDLGKSFDTFCPMGPWIVTADELDGRATQVRCWVTPAGGTPELRQDANTRQLIFDIPTLIETCSRGITLYPGDLIATGTAAGVGMGMKPPRWLGPGDMVRIEIEGLGAIENRFIEDEA